MIKVKMTGFDKALKNLKRLEQNARKLDGRHEVSFRDLFPPSFMQANTQHGTFEELLKASPFTVKSPEDFAAIPDEPWDEFIRSATRFDSWKAMHKAAMADYVKRRMREGLR
jgi:hypothetical protein